MTVARLNLEPEVVLPYYNSVSSQLCVDLYRAFVKSLECTPDGCSIRLYDIYFSNNYSIGGGLPWTLVFCPGSRVVCLFFCSYWEVPLLTRPPPFSCSFTQCFIEFIELPTVPLRKSMKNWSNLGHPVDHHFDVTYQQQYTKAYLLNKIVKTRFVDNRQH